MALSDLAFWIMAVSTVACALGMVTSKNPVHSALWLVGNFVSLAVIFLILSAPMLFAMQLIVYAGAIMVLFLFVVMFFMAPRARLWLRPPLRMQQFFGGLLTLGLMIGLAYSVAISGAQLGFGKLEESSDLGLAFLKEANPILSMGNPHELSMWLLTKQVLPFELMALLLLAAVLGALMVARDTREEGRTVVERHAPTALRGVTTGAANAAANAAAPGVATEEVDA